MFAKLRLLRWLAVRMLDDDLDVPIPATMRRAANLRRRPAALALLVVCTCAFIGVVWRSVVRSDDGLGALVRSTWSLDEGARVLSELGALDVTSVWLDGEWWRLLTGGLLHASWLHLGLNGSALWVLARWAEPLLGSGGLLLVVLACSAAGCLASLVACEASIVVGLSAGVLGLASCLIVLRVWGAPSQRHQLAEIAHGQLILWLVVCLGFGFVVPVVALGGHIGGLASGFLFGLAQRKQRIGAGWIRSVGVSIPLAILAALLLRTSPPAVCSSWFGLAWLDRGEPDRAVSWLERAWIRSPNDASTSNALAYAMALAGIDLARAEALAKTAMAATTPVNPDYLDTLGWIQCLRGRPEEGLEALELAVSMTRSAEIEGHRDACKVMAESQS